MKWLLTLLLLLPTPALANPAGWVDQIYNVRYSEVTDYGDGTYKVSVIWYDEDDWEIPTKQICKLEGVRWVWWADLGEYMKAHQDVSDAASDDFYRCK